MKKFIYIVLMLMPASYLQSAEITVTMHSLGNDGPEKAIGVIVVKETAQGLRFEPYIRSMEPGKYMFSLNENVGCGSRYTTSGFNIPGMAAGKSIKQLPAITVDSQGVADQWITAENMALRDVRGRTLVISTQSKSPANVSHGTEQRVACGTLELYR